MSAKQTTTQKILRKLYPFIMKMGKKGKNGTILVNEKSVAPVRSFYELEAIRNNGEKIDFSSFKGKKVLIVNTASKCGYTGQYAELQKLHEQLGDNLVIIGFPANDFANQETGADSEIAEFCQVNYGVTFPLAKKGVVVKTAEQQPVFKWLSDKNQNGWNDHCPDWNFSKYLVNENGILTHYFGPSVSPLEPEFVELVK